MRNHSLFKFCYGLSKSEFDHFISYLNSPYFDRKGAHIKPEHKRMGHLLRHYCYEKKTKVCSRSSLFSEIFPGKKPKAWTTKMSKLIGEMTAHLIRFLGTEYSQSQRVSQWINALNHLVSKNRFEQINQTLNDLKGEKAESFTQEGFEKLQKTILAQLASIPKDDSYFLQLYRFKLLKVQLEITEKDVNPNNLLIEPLPHLKAFYNIHRYRFALGQVSKFIENKGEDHDKFQTSVNTYLTKLEKELLTLDDSRPIPEAIEFYEMVFNLYKNPEDNHLFNNAKSFLVEKSDQFVSRNNAEIGAEFYYILYNFVVGQTFQGKEKIRQELTDLTSLFLEKVINASNITVPPEFYRTYCLDFLIGMKNAEMNTAEKKSALHKIKTLNLTLGKRLPTPYRSALIPINKGLVAFYEDDFKSAKIQFLKVSDNRTYYYYNVIARMNLIRCHFELKDFDLLETELINATNILTNEKLPEERTASYKEFVNYMGKLNKNIGLPKKKKGLNMLSDEIKTKNIAYKAWILEKIQTL